MARLEGTISMTGLPPHRGLILNVCFFSVDGPGAPVPYDGDPPAEAATDCDKVFEQVDLNNESQQEILEHHFGVERALGYYYVQVRPIHIGAEAEAPISFPIAWPRQPLE